MHIATIFYALLSREKRKKKTYLVKRFVFTRRSAPILHSLSTTKRRTVTQQEKNSYPMRLFCQYQKSYHRFTE